MAGGDSPISHSPRLAVFFTSLQIILLLLVWGKLPPQVPLLYSRPWGEEQIVAKSWLFLLPFLSLMVAVSNQMVASFLAKEVFIGKILGWATAVFALLALITLFQIIRLVI